MKIISKVKKKFLGIEPPIEPPDEDASEMKSVDKRAWRLIDIIWWPVETESQAKQAIFVCLIFTCYGAVTWTFSEINRLLFSPFPNGYFNIISSLLGATLQPAILILIAWGLFKIKRGAAIAGFGFFFISIIQSGYFTMTAKGAMPKWEIEIFFRYAILAFIYIHGFRGISSYTRFCQSEIASTEKEIQQSTV
ncbi:MAG: hypothetical protein ABSG42_05570 [Nitrospirota bacterium]